ncbi:hypothetical protein ACG83_04710 [Frankia sp. R43]|nr:hypothetical protein ACG83_39715 [Frankia sp. R43]KPM57712.1 hypothetical protein ACG83_04710 [Frankia sp. R43]
MSCEYIIVPEHVRALDVGPATVIVNYRNGRADVLTGPAARWWEAATTSGYGDPSGLLDTQSARALREQLLTAELIMQTPRHRAGQPTAVGPSWVPSWGTQEMQAGRTTVGSASCGMTLRAGVALLVVLGALAAGQGRSRMARLLRLLTWATRRARVDASADHLMEAVNAVRRAGTVMPGRVACLEESSAAFLLLAMGRKRVTWCHGAAADPVRLHAWVETDDGQRVAEPSSTARFGVLRAVPERDDGSENRRA